MYVYVCIGMNVTTLCCRFFLCISFLPIALGFLFYVSVIHEFIPGVVFRLRQGGWNIGMDALELPMPLQIWDEIYVHSGRGVTGRQHSITLQ